MIYFDKNKEAYAYEIPEYVATVDDKTWNVYAGTDKWDILDGEFVDITETEGYKARQLAKAKASKLAEIDAKAYEYENKGLIEYTGKTAENEVKTVEIETTVVNIGKINGLINMFNAKLIEEYPWSSKDDTPIILTVEDAYNLTALFAQFSADIWMVKQPYYKGLVNQAQSAEEVEAIEIDYSKEAAGEKTDTNDSEVV